MEIVRHLIEVLKLPGKCKDGSLPPAAGLYLIGDYPGLGQSLGATDGRCIVVYRHKFPYDFDNTLFIPADTLPASVSSLTFGTHKYSANGRQLEYAKPQINITSFLANCKELQPEPCTLNLPDELRGKLAEIVFAKRPAILSCVYESGKECYFNLVRFDAMLAFDNRPLTYQLKLNSVKMLHFKGDGYESIMVERRDDSSRCLYIPITNLAKLGESI